MPGQPTNASISPFCRDSAEVAPKPVATCLTVLTSVPASFMRVLR